MLYNYWSLEEELMATNFSISLAEIMKELAGEFAGRIWNALNETEGLTLKEIKKATKLKDKELYLGLGWLLREDKIFNCVAGEEEIFALK